MGKFVFVTGGVVSSLGKGLAAAAIGMLLRSRDLEVRFLKFDPYLNLDAGTMNPGQHGEVFVTEDGAETDLDLGHYERFADVTLTRNANVTAGRIYADLLNRERAGGYDGATLQVVPHFTDALQASIRWSEGGPRSVTLVELGGTIGDIEGMPFVEAIRQFLLGREPEDALSLHMVLLPRLAPTGETKTKPAQHSVQRLRAAGLRIDYLLCRSEAPLSEEFRDRLARSCQVPREGVFGVPDVQSVYDLPELLRSQGFDDSLCARLNLEDAPSADLGRWRTFTGAVHRPERSVRVAVIAKYGGMADCYKSLGEAFVHAGAAQGIKVKADWLAAEELEECGGMAVLAGTAGVVVPGGFGRRGVEGKMAAIRWARETNTPFLGLCYGLHCAVVEFARHVCGAPSARSGEWREPDEAPGTGENDWITLLNGQGEGVPLGGTLRLGAQPCDLAPCSKARAAYGADRIYERHRHRYEVHPARVPELERYGLRVSGRHPDNGLVEMVELEGADWFVATQAHPEFKSRPLSPHPLFLAFLDAVLRRADKIADRR
ncbi:MAG: CTP synthase [Planctomycetes bacterium]|nr:CTP synthase [Planctomycetota bacterium]